MLSVESRTKSHLLSKKKEEATLHTASLGTKSEAAAGGLSRHRELWNNVERQARTKLPNPACLTQPEVTKVVHFLYWLYAIAWYMLLRRCIIYLLHVLYDR